MDRKSELMEYTSNSGKAYNFKVGNIEVEMVYSKNGRKIDECMLNVFKQKIRRG